MEKNVVIISTSLRKDSNSDALALAFAQGAEAAGHKTDVISLRGKKLGFCTGCFSCLEKGDCIIPDDAPAIEEAVLHADVVVFASPIYYYEMSGQMKTLIDRMNSLYPKNYRFRDVYFLSSAAEEDAEVPQRAISGLQGWIDCFPKSRLAGTVFCGGMNAPGEIAGNPALQTAFTMGQQV